MRAQFSQVAWLCAAFVFALLPSADAAEVEGEAETRAAAKALLPFMAPDAAKSVEEHFTPGFLKQVDAAQMGKILEGYGESHGRATEVRLIRMSKPFTAEVEYLFEKEIRIPATVVVDGKPPHRISGIFFRHAVKDNDTFATIDAELKELKGTVGYCLTRLGSDGERKSKPEIVSRLNGDKPLGVASGFKLVVLAALLDEIAAGKRSWKDLVTLRQELRVPHSGIMVDWPAGSPVTVHTLATLMIARSDNTAADHLIDLLGRGRIESMQESLGVKSPNLPFLKVGEFIKLKLVLKPEQQRAFVAADEAGRRKLLDTTVKDAPFKQMRPLDSPVLVDRVEWFFTPAEMCRIMDWLRRQDKTPEGRQILAINPGLALDETFWTYAGYKGGAEPGLLNITLLLKTKDGVWYALSISWTNPDGDADLTQLNGFAHRILRLVQKGK